MSELRILSLEDVAYDAELLEREIRKAGTHYTLKRVETRDAFLDALTEFQPDIILADYSLPQFSAIEALRLLRQRKSNVPVILVTGSHSEEAAVECMKEGAEDYILKASLTRLPNALQNALRKKEAERNKESVESALKQSEAQYRLITENTRDLICLLDGHNRFLYASPSYELVLGFRPSDLIGTDCFDLIYPDDLALARRAAEQARRHRQQRTAELRHRHREGQWVLFESAASLPAETEGKPRRVVMVSRDITERKRAEQEIEHLATFPRYNPNPVLAFAADGRMIYFNDAALAMARSFDKGHPSEILPANSAAVVQKCVVGAQRSIRIDTNLAGRTISWTFYPIGATQSVHCYAEDITERLSLEAQLRRSQKMESIGQLAAGIAHDFNNILTIIQGRSSLLLHDPALDRTAHESLKQICVASERAANLTRQLLLFSRKQLAQPKPLNLNGVIESVAEMLEPLLGESVVVALELAPELSAINADDGMIEQIILNLAVNSRDAMPRGGQIVIGTFERQIDERYVRHQRESRAGRFVCLRVSDTGTGMTSEVLAHVFEPFFTTKEVGKGTGLGLATVYGIVKQHDGWIEVETRENTGTTFTIFFPATAERPATQKTNPQSPRVPGGHETILVVEDEPPLRELVSEILRRSGYTVLAASTANEALEVWNEKKHQIDLLLTDIMMPEGISGRDLAQRILADRPDTRVLYTSGYPKEVIGPDLFAEGQYFLQKPYQPLALAQAVRECLDTEGPNHEPQRETAHSV